MQIILLGIWLYLLGYDTVLGLWAVSNEVARPGYKWPTCFDTDICCAQIFPYWTSQASRVMLNDAPAIYSSDARIDNANPLIVSFDCADNRQFWQIERSGEPRTQGRLWMICPASLPPAYYMEPHRGPTANAPAQWETKASCETTDSTREPVNSGLTACRQILSKAAGISRIKARFTNDTPVHIEITDNTAGTRDGLTQPISTKGLSISIAPITDDRNVLPLIEHDHLTLTYPKAFPSRQSYRVCGHAPPGHGSWSLWISEVSA